jgi:geranylgeranylglycerol-phosphate geranylgeranyltransferase
MNGAIASAAVLVGAFIARRPPAWGPAVLGAACAFLAASAANALNDVRDRAADAVNRPERPIPSGRVAAGHAMRLSLVLSAGAVCVAVPLGGWPIALVAAWIVLTAAYSVSLKAVPFVGNAVVSVVAASPLVLGALSQAAAAAAVVPTGLAFLAHLVRESVKDAEDIEGDARVGVRTLAVVRGAGAALSAARIAIVLLMVAAPVPYFAGLYGIGYAVAVALAEAVLGNVLHVLVKSPDRAGLRRASTRLKWVMPVGLVAFVLGVVF